MKKNNSISFAEDVEQVIVLKTENQFSGFCLTSLTKSNMKCWDVQYNDGQAQTHPTAIQNDISHR